MSASSSKAPANNVLVSALTVFFVAQAKRRNVDYSHVNKYYQIDCGHGTRSAELVYIRQSGHRCNLVRRVDSIRACIVYGSNIQEVSRDLSFPVTVCDLMRLSTVER